MGRAVQRSLHGLIAAFVLAAGACAPRPALRVPSELPGTANWKLRMEERLKRLEPFQALYSARLTDPQGRTWHTKAVLIVDLPDRIRLEILSPTNQTQGVLVVSGNKASLWLISDNTLYTAPDSARLMGLLMGWDAPAPLLASLLLGCLPERDLKSPAPSIPAADSGEMGVVTVQDSAGSSRRVYHVRQRTALLEKVILFNRDGEQGTIVLHYEKETDGLAVPDVLTLESRDNQLRLSRRAFEILESADPALFALPPAAFQANRIQMVQ